MIVIVGTKPTGKVEGVVVNIHVLSLVGVGTRVQYGVPVPACSALALCIAVRMPRVIEVFSINTKVRYLGDHQL